MRITRTGRVLATVAVAAVLGLAGTAATGAGAAEPPPRAGGWPGTAEPLNWPPPTTTTTTAEDGFIDPGPGAPGGPFGSGPRW
jgi:hypothetical protein